MTGHSVIPDASFYICFLNDIDESGLLCQFIEYKKFDFVSGPIIKSEVLVINNDDFISFFNKNVSLFDYYKHSEIIKPLFSDEEINNGETETIVISYIIDFSGQKYITIIDDKAPRKFIEDNFPNIQSNLVGTIGFIEKCACECKIISAHYAISVLESIKESKFRIDNKLIEITIERVGGC